MVEARGAYIMTRVHNELQNAFRQRLVGLYGSNAVRQEEDYIDLLVSLPDKLILIEVKASASPVTCVREALGQILQYAWRLGPDTRHIEYVIVGPASATQHDRHFFDFIRTKTGLDIRYCTSDNYADNVRKTHLAVHRRATSAIEASGNGVSPLAASLVKR